MTIGALRAAGARVLRQHGVESPELDAGLLLAHLLNKDRTWLLLNQEEPCGSALTEQYFALLSRRASGESVAYITGKKEFMGLEFSVSPAVLVPRPDTELLTEKALEWLSDHTTDVPLKVLDVCSGSGCIGISLAHYTGAIDLTLSDISPDALEISRRNSIKILGEQRAQLVRFIHSDLLDYFLERNETFDLIVSNPPYVPTSLIPGLAKEVQGEPRLALDGGEHGLRLIHRLIPQASRLLKGNGVLFLESDPEQVLSIQELLKNNGFHGIECYPDLSGTLRCTRGSKPLHE